MSEFILDTSGSVDCPSTANPSAQCICHGRTFDRLDPFTQGYIEALFFTSCDPSVSMTEIDPDHEFRDGSIPADAGFSDLHPESLASIIADCAEFQRDHETDLKQAYEETEYSANQAGRDFWLTRNGHGAGFWDRDALDWYAATDNSRKLQDILTAAANDAGGRDATWGTAADGAESPTGHGFVFVE